MKLVTRSDFDGLVCAAILKELDIVEEILYAHPKDLQDGKIEVSENDVLANVPFVEGCGLWFDHHTSEYDRLQLEGKYKGASRIEPSTARVIYNFYSELGGYEAKLSSLEEMVQAADKADSGQYTRDDIVNPQGWMMLAFIADPRTGLGYRRTFRISNFDLMKQLPDLLRMKSIDDILALPDFQERIKVYREESDTYKTFIKENSYVDGDAIVIDLRQIDSIPTGNRFIEYTIYPDQNISLRLVTTKSKENIMISIGHSTLNKTSQVDVGSLTLQYGGGGHKKVGTCQVLATQVEEALKHMLDVINNRV